MSTENVRGIIAQNIKKYRKESNLTQKELGDLVGVKHNTISGYESGVSEPEQNMLFKIAKALHVSINDLFPTTCSAIEEVQPPWISIPLVGDIVAGEPIFAEENIIGYIDVNPKIAKGGEYFALKVKGSSMEPVITENDTVVVRKQPNVENGDLAVVSINGNEATLKKIKKSSHGITLVAYNVAVYEPHFYSHHDCIELPVQIIGKVVQMIRDF